VLVAALMVLLGSLMLANRSSDGVRQLTHTITVQEGTTSTAITRPCDAGTPTQAGGVY